MPYVEVKITREGNTPDQKAAVIRGITEVLQRELGKDPWTTFVVLEEIGLDDWGIGGRTVREVRSGVS
ncbi:MAG: 4-oxalocrotonate tautomerase family protein [Planctomycetota bacterium]